MYAPTFLLAGVREVVVAACCLLLAASPARLACQPGQGEGQVKGRGTLHGVGAPRHCRRLPLSQDEGRLLRLPELGRFHPELRKSLNVEIWLYFSIFKGFDSPKDHIPVALRDVANPGDQSDPTNGSHDASKPSSARE